jgi:hypothetical protein
VQFDCYPEQAFFREAKDLGEPCECEPPRGSEVRRRALWRSSAFGLLPYWNLHWLKLEGLIASFRVNPDFVIQEAVLKKIFVVPVFFLLTIALCVPPLFSQASGTVKGVCKDVQGNPVADGVVVWSNQDNGQKYTLKTNKKGEYFSLGLSPGFYNVTLYKTSDDAKANKELFHFNHFQVQLDENNLDFDLQKEQQKQAAGQGMTPEQLKAQQEAQAKVAKENLTIKQLNDMISTANAASKSGDYDSAIGTLTQATQIDANRDILWAQLADAYRGSASKQTDLAEKTKRYGEAVDDYQKAIELKQKAMDAATKKDPADNQRLAAY